MTAQKEVKVRIFAGSASPFDRFCSKSSSGPERRRVDAAPLSDPICYLLCVSWNVVIVIFFLPKYKTNVKAA